VAKYANFAKMIFYGMQNKKTATVGIFIEALTRMAVSYESLQLDMQNLLWR